jgi:hypothetical protein
MADLQAAAAAYPHRRDLPPDSLRLDWLMSAASVWLLIGLFLDGWAHNTFPEDIETFLTPWHAVLYSGFAAAAAILIATTLWNAGRGYAGFNALPRGYLLALAGVVIFGFAGTFDFAWHSLFGFEADQEALLSPPHLALALGGCLMVSAPLRAAWGRALPESKSGWRELLPALLSLATLLSIFTFFTQYANVFQHANLLVGPRPDQTYFRDTTILAGVILPAAIMMGFVLLAVRRWRLPFGSLTLLLASNSVLMFVMGIDYSGRQWPIVPAALAGGLIADGLLQALKPASDRPGALRLFAFGVPFLYFALYFAALLLTGGLWWRVHMWLGAPLLAGITGLSLSFLLVPPVLPAARPSADGTS